MWRRALILVVIVALCPQPAETREDDKFVGLSLADALARLQAEGLRIVFSTAVVEPSMTVQKEPQGDDPRNILDQIVAEHGLRAQDGPGGTILVLVAMPEDSGGTTAGKIRGIVTVGGIRTNIADLVVTIAGTDLEATNHRDGGFSIDEVPPGRYTVTANSTRYTTQSIEDVEVRSGRVSRLRFDLVPVSVFLNEVIVTPSHFRLLEERPESHQFLNRDEVRQMPHVADDLYRAIKRLPGSAGGDFTAKINVRGGEQDELLVIVDGLEIYEPFHLKDFQNVFSIIDSEAVGGVDFLTGGFPVEYGDRMSGVMDISVGTPTGPATGAVDLSTINARLLGQGSFNRDRGQWFVSARAWYPDAIAERRSESPTEVLTDYYDVLAKVEHRIGDRSQLSANLLVAYDDLGYREADEEEVQSVTAEYGSYSTWLNLRSQWSEGLFSQTVLSAGRLKRHRTGMVDDVVEGTLMVDDNRSFQFVGLRQDWTHEFSERNLLKWGFDLRYQEADYDYESLSTLEDSGTPGGADEPPTVINTHLEPEGASFAIYLADRIRIIDPVVVELGLRWDRQHWIGDNQISPRVNLVYSATTRTIVRAAWGRFHQSQRLNELQVEDGVDEYFPAQLAEHWMVGLEHAFKPGLSFRFEIFRKDLSNLRPRYENLFNPVQLFPESSSDRIRVAPDRGLVRGVEIVLKATTGPTFSWWASYVLARAEDQIDGTWEPRSWDQRHALTAGLNLDLPHDWSLNLAALYHTGWPTTELLAEVAIGEDGEPEVETSYGSRNALKYPAYARLDLRVSKFFPTRHGEFKAFLEIINLSNRENVCCTEDFEFEIEDDLAVTVIPETRNWATFIPTLGIGWRF
jgi:outer membrane receptor protein involved in Fe transport